MCGIWASIGYEVDHSVLDVIAHRGPDGSGMKQCSTPAGPLALGHRRLAVIDVSNQAAQPMSYEDGRLSITLNGEIYNFETLRRELQALGFRFRTVSDTEVALAAFAAWGGACLSRFEGMFSLVIHDARTQRLFVARDRFGIKPLYFTASGGRIAFASEIKQLLLLPGHHPRPNLDALFDFLTAGLSDQGEESMFRDVKQIDAGCCAWIDLSASVPELEVEQTRWYQLPVPGSLRLSRHDAVDAFRSAFADAVRMHLRADVRVGSCLSGGLDSSSIVGMAATMLRNGSGGTPFESVTAVFDSPEIDERIYARAVAKRHATVALECAPTPEGMVSAWDRMVWHQDLPFASSSLFAQFCVFQAARASGLKVMLDGQGADELLAGYHGAYPVYYRQLFRSGQMIDLLACAAGRAMGPRGSASFEAQSVLFALLPQVLRRQLLIRRHVRHYAALVNDPSVDGAGFRQTPLMRSIGSSTVPAQGLGELCCSLTGASSLPALLRYEDRSSMAHGVEARVPFLHRPLVELCIGLGNNYKIEMGTTKAVMRDAMRHLLPPLIADRRDKIGFATPERAWMTGALGHHLKRDLDVALESLPKLFRDNRKIRNEFELIRSGRGAIDSFIWRVCSVGAWIRVFGIST